MMERASESTTVLNFPGRFNGRWSAMTPVLVRDRAFFGVAVNSMQTTLLQKSGPRGPRGPRISELSHVRTRMRDI